MQIMNMFLLCLTALLALQPLATQAEPVFSVNTADQVPYSTLDNTGIYDRIVLQAFGNLGLKAKINHLPSARSIENVQQGFDDAEYARVTGLSEQYPNLVQVKEKLIDFAFTAFGKRGDLPIDGWESLANYHVGYIRGWKIYENKVTDAKSITVVSSVDDLFRLLQNDRIDIALYERERGLYYLQQNGMDHIMPLEKPIAVRGMYLYLNKKHQLERRRFSWTLIWGRVPVSKEIDNDEKQQERNRYRTSGRRAAVECCPQA